MFEVIVLAVALSMDAFAVSIGLGSKGNARGLGLKAGLFFGAFQALMPFIGYLGGKGVLGWVDAYAHWIAFGLLALIGAKMIYEGLHEGIEEDIAAITNKMMLLLAIATSIGVTTFAFSWVGVQIGKNSGTWLESKAEIFGGVVLILIGINMLVV
ncbi:MAG TPA: manganese efflux pump MntP family protein [Gallionella sp.]